MRERGQGARREPGPAWWHLCLHPCGTHLGGFPLHRGGRSLSANPPAFVPVAGTAGRGAEDRAEAAAGGPKRRDALQVLSDWQQVLPVCLSVCFERTPKGKTFSNTAEMC